METPRSLESREPAFVEYRRILDGGKFSDIVAVFKFYDVWAEDQVNGREVVYNKGNLQKAIENLKATGKSSEPFEAALANWPK